MSPTQRIRWAFRAAAVVLGAAQVAVSWNDITPDGISYLDLARAYLRHDWAMTINAYWGPVYSWLLAGVLGVFRPSLRWEFPLVHLLQGLLLLGCVGAFEYFWGSLLHERAARTDKESAQLAMISNEVMWLLGYSLFIWLVTGEVISLINPDMLLTIEVLLIAGLAVRIHGDGNAGWVSYLSFGFLLGIGYLTKAVMFPLAFVFLAVSLLANRSQRHFVRLATSALIFLAVALPWIALLSHSKGRLTFSDTGRLNFAWFNYGLPYVHWQGEPPESGTAAHPTRKIFAQPPVFEFNGPLRASYPPWFDPSYWNEGLSPGFKPWVVAKHAARGLVRVGYRLIMPLAWMAGIFLLLLGSEIRASLRGALGNWPLLMVSAAALGLYALTLVVSRYLVPWQLLFWGGMLAGLRGRRRGATVSWWLGLAVASVLVAGTAINVYRWPSFFGARDNAKPDYAIAQGLSRMGIRAGDQVASIGYDYQGYWAYLDRVSIVAEIRAEDGCRFWRDSAEVQGEILSRLALAGAKAVVANDGGGVKVEAADLSCVHPESGWRRIDGSRDYVYFLP